MQADERAPLAVAAARRHELTRAKAIQALRELDRAGTPVTFAAVAAAGSISRSWLYTNPELRDEIERLRQRRRSVPARAIPDRQRTSDASLLRRLDTANGRIHELQDDNRRLRDALAEALGANRVVTARGSVSISRSVEKNSAAR